MLGSARLHPYLVHIFGVFVTPISIDVNDSTEYWAIYDTYNVKVNRDDTNFTTDIAWIARDVIILFFRFKNLNILCVNDLKTKRQLI